MSPSLRRDSSASRIILVSLVLLVLGLVLVSFLVLRLLEQDTRRLLFDQQFSAAALVADRIDRILRDQITVFEGIAEQLVSEEGKLLSLPVIESSLADRLHLRSYFNGGLLLLDLNAAVLVAVSPLPPEGPDEKPFQFRQTQHLQRLFAHGRPQVGPPLRDRAGGGLLPVSVPVFAADGTPLAILTGLVDLAADNFLDREAAHPYAATGDYLVIDPDSGLFLAAADKSRVLQPVPEPGVNPMHDRYMVGFEGSGIARSSLGEMEVTSAKRVATSDWFVVARLPAVEAFAPLRRLQQRILLVVLITMLPLAGLAVWFIKRQLDPLVTSADLIDEMIAGRRAVTRLPVNREDELGRLLHGFNHLLATVQAAEEKFRSMAETSLDLIFQIAADGRITYCSPAAGKIMKLPPEKIVGTDFRTHVSPEDLGKAQRAFAAAISGESARLWEINLRQGGGSTFVGEVNIGPIKENGRVVGAQGVVRDVSARRRAALELARQLMFQKMVAGISTRFVTATGTAIHDAVEEALAQSGAFFSLDRSYIFTFPEDGNLISNSHEWCAPGIASFKDRVQQVPCSEFPWIIEQVHRESFVHLPDVSKLPLAAAAERAEFAAQEIKSLLLLPLWVADGGAPPPAAGAGGNGREKVRLLGFLGYDAVRRQRSWRDEEITLLKVMAEIITGALERNRIEEELERKRRELARSNADLTDFAYIASHDLQEPLRKVTAFGDRLEQKYGEQLGDKGRDYLARMCNAAGRMQGLIDDLLLYSRVNTRGAEFAEVDLGEVMGEVLEALERPIEELAAEIRVDELPVLPAADRRQMHSLLQNLVGNALKYHRPGVKPEIRVEAAADDRWWEIRVSDNGIGFDDKYLDRIFRPFQRLHGRSEYKGSGIGLAICKKIVERHGGELGAAGRPGAGATFTVRLPRNPN